MNALFLAPVLFAFTMVMVIPFFLGIYYSMTDFNGVRTNLTFVGLKNYETMFSDPLFLHSFLVTVEYTVINVIFVNVVAFALSLMVTSNLKGRNFLRAGFFVPNLIGGIVLGWIWNLLLTGILDKFGRTLVYSEAYGFWGLTVLMLWQQAGYMMIIYIAGLQSIPDDLIEAASIDGATPLQTLFKIKIPMVMPSITICTFLTLTNSFKLFDQNLALLSAESSGKLKLLALDIYETFYGRNGWEGAGQAKAVVFTIIVALIAMVQMRLTNRKEVQQ